jgi:transposase
LAAAVSGAGAGRHEAGPTGYGWRVHARSPGSRAVAAPSKIPRASGDRVKTDRRDAGQLAACFSWASWWQCRCPTAHEEAAQDLVRAREDARAS